MITNWRLTSDVVLMFENIGEGNRVYIASPEKKQYEVAVSKLSGNIYTKETIENADFEVKIGVLNDSPEVYIKTSQLPTLGWTVVANFYGPSVWSILSQCTSDHGVLGGKFKVSFTESDLKVVSLVSPDMKEYLEADNEMTRRLRCEIGRKTKTLKPGHRYDIPKETRYYLCPVVSRKLNNCASNFQDDATTLRTSGYIYTNLLYDGDNSVSDILRTRKFGIEPGDLKVSISDGTSWIDSGQKLTDDFSGNLKDYWELVVDNTLKYGVKKIQKSDFQVCTNLPDVLGILGCQSSADLGYNISESLKDKLVDAISGILEYNLLKFWRLKSAKPELEISDKKDYDKNADALERLFYLSLEDGNIHKFAYYQNLFGRLGIDMNKLSEITVTNFSEADLTDSFDNYMKYRFYWRNKKAIYYSDSRPVLDYTLIRTPEGMPKIEDLFGRTELSKTLSDLYSYAASNYGEGISEYRVILPDKKATEQCVFCCITLEDILKFKKGASGMSDSLKNEIVLNKFDNITINCKLSDKL